MLDAADAAQASIVVVPLVDNGALHTADEVANLRQGLEELAAHPRRLRIAFESDYPPARLADFISGFAPERFGINWDLGNSASLGFAPEDEIEAYGGRILHVHVKDRVLGGTTVPLGDGAARLAEAFAELRRIGYQGDYVLQTARARDGDHAAAAARYLLMTQDWISP